MPLGAASFPGRRAEVAMAVQKSVDLTATGPTIDQAVQDALGRALLTLEGVTSFDLEHIGGTFENGRPAFRVQVRVWFTLLERVHE
jgi:flavin-binding protein dodecin